MYSFRLTTACLLACVRRSGSTKSDLAIERALAVWQEPAKRLLCSNCPQPASRLNHVEDESDKRKSLASLFLALRGTAPFHVGRHPMFSGRQSFQTPLRSGMLNSVRASATSAVLAEKAAVTHPAFDVTEDTDIDEYGLHTTIYRHKKSGAQVLSVMAPEDSNKVFGIVFRTPPEDSTGLPHILEHSVLCGSRKFTTKAPFVDLLKGSVNTFLNAFTYPDRTCYPVASMNTKDFYNLVNVYLDSVLHPRAVSDSRVLQQEGWHYELEDPEKELQYKGVVYNEMKGVYSSPDSIRQRATQQALFPDNAYGVDSGGDPRRIPDLDFKQFKDFHSKYYHPSNARAYFYGDDDPFKRLEILDGYFSEFDEIQVDSRVKFQKKIEPEAQLKVPYPVQDAASAKHTVTLNWLLNDAPLSTQDELALDLMSDLLSGRSSRPLRKKLTESGLGESVVGGGVSTSLLQATFSVGMKGVKPEDVSKVDGLVSGELERLSKDGFDADDIKAAINSLEFRLREFNTGSFPRGLMIMLGAFNKWNYDMSPTDAIRFEKPLQQLKDDLEAGKPVFQDLLKRYLVSNTHKVVVEMLPDADLEAANQKWEEDVLRDAKEKMTASDIQEVIENTKKLKDAQAAEDTPEALASIPRLELDDIKKEVEIFPIEVEKLADGVQVITHDLETAGILYADIGFDFSTISEEDLVLFPLMTRMLTETGTKDMDEVQLGRRIDSETGGISVQQFSHPRHVSGTVSNLDDPIMLMLLRGKATKDKIPNLIQILQDVLLNSRLDNKKRAVEMLKEMKVGLENSVITNGMSYAGTRLAARRSLLGYVRESTSGLTYVRNIATLLEDAESDWPKVQARLEALRDLIVRKGEVVINLTGNKEILDASKLPIENFIKAIPSPGDKKIKLAESFQKSKLLSERNEGFSVASQVNYVVKSTPLIQEGEAMKGSFSVASKFLSIGYLWNKVRVMGGAYGGSAGFSPDSGVVTFSSYRDPNLAATLSVYDRAGEELAESISKMTDTQLTEAIIGSIGDRPLSADQKGLRSLTHYLTGVSVEDRQRWRDEVLSTSREDLLDFANRLKNIQKNGSTAVFASQAALDAANEALPEDGKLGIEPAILSKRS